MTTKTIKTILFAALFAAMILPFSGMGSVYAEGENLPTDAELGESDTIPVKTPGDAPWDKEHGEISMELPEVIQTGESDEELPEYEEVEVDPSRSRATPIPDDGANLPEEDTPDGTNTP